MLLITECDLSSNWIREDEALSHLLDFILGNAVYAQNQKYRLKKKKTSYENISFKIFIEKQFTMTFLYHKHTTGL